MSICRGGKIPILPVLRRSRRHESGQLFNEYGSRFFENCKQTRAILCVLDHRVELNQQCLDIVLLRPMRRIVEANYNRRCVSERRLPCGLPCTGNAACRKPAAFFGGQLVLKYDFMGPSRARRGSSQNLAIPNQFQEIKRDWAFRLDAKRQRRMSARNIESGRWQFAVHKKLDERSIADERTSSAER